MVSEGDLRRIAAFVDEDRSGTVPGAGNASRGIVGETDD
jgi:hypothetical protein